METKKINEIDAKIAINDSDYFPIISPEGDLSKIRKTDLLATETSSGLMPVGVSKQLLPCQENTYVNKLLYSYNDNGVAEKELKYLLLLPKVNGALVAGILTAYVPSNLAGGLMPYIGALNLGFCSCDNNRLNGHYSGGLKRNTLARIVTLSYNNTTYLAVELDYRDRGWNRTLFMFTGIHSKFSDVIMVGASEISNINVL